jgi:hypothetical protein
MCQTTEHQSIENRDINIHRSENLKSHMLYIPIKTKLQSHFFKFYIFPMFDWQLVTTAWRVLRLRMVETPSSLEGSCEYIQ